MLKKNLNLKNEMGKKYKSMITVEYDTLKNGEHTTSL
jgi:hypothetical protein